MASLKLVLFISLALFSISTATRVIPQSQFPSQAPLTTSSSLSQAAAKLSASPSPQIFIPVCDKQRYFNLGLNASSFSFCDTSLPFDVRAKDLVDSMTVEEKVAQLGNNAIGVPRLGLPKYEWWSEALHGVSNVGPGTKFTDVVPSATSFPTPILTTASFNETLWRTIGETVSTEARAMHNLGIAGLTYWSPTMNVVRDPRWGRTLETPGEDPFVVGRYSVNYVRGLQDVKGHENPTDLKSRPLKVSACCKHYAAYDIDNWLGVDRFHFDAKVTEQDMLETFLRPFEMCVKDGDVSSVMCSYNRVNGIPTCADPKLLSDTIRGEWNLNGYIVSDCDSIEVMRDGHKWLDDTAEDAVQQVLRAGLDLDCGDFYPKHTLPAIDQGKVRESDVDKALRNLYIVLMRLGHFDGSPQYAALGKDDVCSEEHIELAAESARQGIVLLKNDNNILPLSPTKYKKLAVVGPHANATTAMIGNYAGVPCRYVSPLEGLSKYAEVNYQIGCDQIICRNDTFIYHAVEASKHSDATIIFVGLDLSIENEGFDRTNLVLPGYQTQLIRDISYAAKSPIILVILSAGGVDIEFAKKDRNIGAILWAGYPGEEGGRAIADVIFGNYNPGGRLPVTWYTKDYVNKLPMTSMQLRPNDALGYPGRTYKFYNGSTVYPFGYGLSYTQFEYSIKSSLRSLVTKKGPYQHCHAMNYKPDAYIPPCPALLVEDTKCDETIDFEIEVHNKGEIDGSHVLIVYSIPPADYVGAPAKQVVGFQRVFVAAGCSVTAKFSLDALKTLSMVTDTAYIVLPWGEHTIKVGDGNGAVTFPVQVSFQ